MPRDYADRLADAMGEGLDSFTARLYARGSRPLRHFLAVDRRPVDPDDEEEDDEDADDDETQEPGEEI